MKMTEIILIAVISVAALVLVNEYNNKKPMQQVSLAEFEELKAKLLEVEKEATSNKVLIAETMGNITKKTNQIGRHEHKIEQLEAHMKQLDDSTDPGKFISEFRKGLGELDKKVRDERNRRLNWQNKMRQYVAKGFKARKPIPIEVVNRLSQKNVRAKVKWSKDKDGSWIKDGVYRFEYTEPDKKPAPKSAPKKNTKVVQA